MQEDLVKKLLLFPVGANPITPQKLSYSPFTLSLTKANGATSRYGFHLDMPRPFTLGGLIPGIIVFAGCKGNINLLIFVKLT